MFNEGFVQEGEMNLVELFQCVLTKVLRKVAAQNSMVRYILHILWSDAVIWRKVADGGVVKHTQLSAKSSTMSCLGVAIL